MQYRFINFRQLAACFRSSVLRPSATTQRETLFPFLSAKWPQSPSSANQIDRLTSISWSSRSEHLNVFWCNNEVWCRRVTKCPGSTIFPGPALFVLGWLISRQLTSGNARLYCCVRRSVHGEESVVTLLLCIGGGVSRSSRIKTIIRCQVSLRGRKAGRNREHVETFSPAPLWSGSIRMTLYYMPGWIMEALVGEHFNWCMNMQLCLIPGPEINQVDVQGLFSAFATCTLAFCGCLRH